MMRGFFGSKAWESFEDILKVFGGYCLLSSVRSIVFPALWADLLRSLAWFVALVKGTAPGTNAGQVWLLGGTAVVLGFAAWRSLGKGNRREMRH